MTMASMLSLSTLLDGMASPSLVGWLLRITLLGAVACLYLALARRAQPALRHAVAVGSLLAVVLLPVASKLLPAVPLPVLRAREAAPMTPLVAISDPAPITIDLAPARSLTPARGAIDVTPVRPVDTVRASRATISSFVREQMRSTTNWMRLAAVLWILVATALLVRLTLAFMRARRISDQAQPITDEFLRVEVERACRVLGVTRFIDIAVSNDVAIPIVTGVLKPRIILPAVAEEWSRERMAVVLLHELAHIRRYDAVTMLFAQVVGASLWFHPFVGMLTRQVRRESERACDDLVLRAGVRGSDYAEHLVSIAKSSSRRDPLAGATLAFAARSTLEQRVASILSARKRVSSPRFIAAVVAASLAMFVAIATARPTERKCNNECTQEATQYQVDKVQFEQAREADQVEYLQAKQEAQQYSYQVQLAGNDDEEENDGESWYDCAHSYYMRGRWDKAGRAYENAAKFGYNRATAYYNAGCSWALAKQPGPAIDALENAFEEGFDDLDMYQSDEDLNSLREDPRFKKLLTTVMNSDEGDTRRRVATRDYDRLVSKKVVDEGDWNSVGID